MDAGAGRLESTATLLALVRDGDRAARERLTARYLPIVTRIAHGRLPARARGMTDTDDLVQVTLLRALDHVEGFELRSEGAFLAYLRRILVNQIRDLARRAACRPVEVELRADAASGEPSPLELAIGRDRMEQYEAALEELGERDREATILRLEMGLTYPEIATAIDAASPNAARMVVARALTRLATKLANRGVSHER